MSLNTPSLILEATQNFSGQSNEDRANNLKLLIEIAKGALIKLANDTTEEKFNTAQGFIAALDGLSKNFRQFTETELKKALTLLEVRDSVIWKMAEITTNDPKTGEISQKIGGSVDEIMRLKKSEEESDNQPLVMEREKRFVEIYGMSSEIIYNVVRLLNARSTN